MAFASCERCGNLIDDPDVLRYGHIAGPCPECGGGMVWMATPFAGLANSRAPSAPRPTWSRTIGSRGNSEAPHRWQAPRAR